MVKFLWIGLFRDRSRSLFPLLVVVAGVSLTVMVHAWVTGVLGDMVESNARFQTGHLRITTLTFKNEPQQSPIEFALGDLDQLLERVERDFPAVYWTPRIRFGGLLDIPDANGETLAQGPVAGLGVDLLGEHSPEIDFLNLEENLVKGRIPKHSQEILVSHHFFEKLNLSLGQAATLISSGMEGGMAVSNFKIVGTVHFGIPGLDRGALIADVYDVQHALYMDNAASEVLGFFKTGYFNANAADQIVLYSGLDESNASGPFAPVMNNFTDSDLGIYYSMSQSVVGGVIGLFIFVMSIVLWNTGIMSGIRRYGEMGVRMALGETQNHIYITLLLEALTIGLIGSLLGTGLALIPAYYLQENGLDISEMMQGNTGVLMSTVMRTRITGTTFWIGLIPGVGATFLGALISGLAIYKRQTAELFKELEL